MTRQHWPRQRLAGPRAVAVPREDPRLAGHRLGWVALALLALLTLAVIGVPRAHAADTKVTVWVNGCPQDFNPPAIQRNGTTYVPLRQGAEAVGAKLRWDKAADKAIITTGAKTVAIGKSQGIMVNGSLLIPLRLMGEALDCRVAWDADALAVRITVSPALITVPT